MRQCIYVLLASLTTLVGATVGRAQGLEPLFSGGPGLYQGGLTDSQGLPGYNTEGGPLAGPFGNPGTHGFYTFLDLTYYSGTWTLGSQTVANRGLLDSTGAITGTPGTLIGSGAEALNTSDLGRRSTRPGFNLGMGYKFDDGTAVTARMMFISKATYRASASLVPQRFGASPSLAETFLWAPVFNFPPNFAGPQTKTGQEGTILNGVVLPNHLFYGIWNGASVMQIEFREKYDEFEIGGRVPLFASPYSSVVGLAGLRHSHFFEQFVWRATSFDVTGVTRQQDTAKYKNRLAQRMYGPYLGASHEVYLGKRLSFSTDTIGALLVNFSKEVVKYELGTEDTSTERKIKELGLVPYVGVNANVWMYPTQGIQLRVGYTANMFFNTRRLEQPVSFNYGALDPVYGNQGFRLLHGLNVGVGFFF